MSVKKYVVVKLYGGLGNQLFQIAFAYALSLKYNRSILIDASAFNTYKIRKYALQNIKLSNEIQNIDNVSFPKQAKLIYKSSTKIYHVIQKIIYSSNANFLFQPILNFLAKLGLFYCFDTSCKIPKYNGKKNIFVYGYFQSTNFFADYEEKIRTNLKISSTMTSKEQIVFDKISSCNAVAVSIRADDDYVNHEELNVCSNDYYYKAMDLIAQKVKNPSFFIFSDRIDRVKEKFSFKYPVVYIEGFKDYESLRLMYSCKHFVISNSSFAWWGAYLSDDPNKNVVAPEMWATNGRLKEIYTDNMIRIKA